MSSSEVGGGVIVGAVCLAIAAGFTAVEPAGSVGWVLADPDFAIDGMMSLDVAAELVVAVKAQRLFVAECAVRRLALLGFWWCSSDLNHLLDSPIRLRHRDILRSELLFIRRGTIIWFSFRH